MCIANRDPALHKETCAAGRCPLLNTAIDADDGNAALRARAREALDGWRTRLSSVISLVARQGTVNSTVRPCAVASIIIRTLEGALMMSRLDEDRYALEIARDHLISYIEDLRVEKRRMTLKGQSR